MLKSRIFILFLCLLFGWIGVHRFYIRRRITGLLLLLLFFFWVLTGNIETGAFFFIPLTLWWLFDIFMIIVGRLKDKDGTIPRWFGQSQKKNIVAEEIEGKRIIIKTIYGISNSSKFLVSKLKKCKKYVVSN